MNFVVKGFSPVAASEAGKNLAIVPRESLQDDLNPQGLPSADNDQLKRKRRFRMRDPFLAAPLIVTKATQPIANALNLQTLPLHVHEIVLAFSFYQSINLLVSPAISTWLFPNVYHHLPKRTRINWDVHFVSLVQSSLITLLALWVIRTDQERRDMDWTGRVWGYTGATGMIQGFSAGYFLWDLMMSTRHVSVLGWGSLAHAVSALIVSTLGFVSFQSSPSYR